jgi:hypothetical protein
MHNIYMGQPIPNIADLDVQAMTGALARFYIRRAARNGFRIDPIDARNRAISALFHYMPEANRKGVAE